MSSPCTTPPAPEELHAQVWRASSLGGSASACVPSGFAALDAELPGGGWPTRGLSEILLPRPAVLEWRLLAPALRGAGTSKPLLLINPPLVPHLAGLQACGLPPQQLVWIRAETPQQQLWAAEQAIKSNAAAAVLAWLPQARPEQIRRLQTHALSTEAPVFVFRPLQQARRQSSAAPLRLAVDAVDWALQLRILKRRGPVFDGVLNLPALPTDLARVMTPRMLAPQSAPALDPVEHSHALARPAQPLAVP
ncbi:translesion DNA synthesis-associated protein ImuA [Paucibacter sp. R3-3]|uniref:Translesion DNA synthesis-associated protein ImuA n=1 Tax=Roseateles agri TaxID=3098619 RepID=A0ABU5DB59_9BURK|nr:translesion DNA synthesis-associated protein ImuA [Paucibacter sp. R3-3]MDY0743056.1 translesion DNA synthesis-associated protein ImuA [Paucibacter sp. R3-3]